MYIYKNNLPNLRKRLIVTRKTQKKSLSDHFISELVNQRHLVFKNVKNLVLIILWRKIARIFNNGGLLKLKRFNHIKAIF